MSEVGKLLNNGQGAAEPIISKFSRPRISYESINDTANPLFLFYYHKISKFNKKCTRGPLSQIMVRKLTNQSAVFPIMVRRGNRIKNIE